MFNDINTSLEDSLIFDSLSDLELASLSTWLFRLFIDLKASLSRFLFFLQLLLSAFIEFLFRTYVCLGLDGLAVLLVHLHLGLVAFNDVGNGLLFGVEFACLALGLTLTDGALFSLAHGLESHDLVHIELFPHKSLYLWGKQGVAVV